VNFVKPDSLFNDGMKPLIYSKKEAEAKGSSWMRAGENIAYYPTPAVRQKFHPHSYNLQQFTSQPTP
jgi:cytosolic carboxypeptidase protein 2/3